MKNLVKTFAIAFAIFTTAGFAAHAEEKETNKTAALATGIYVTKAGKVNVLVEKYATANPTVVLLKNKKGDILYKETVNKNTTRFGKQFVLDGLTPGTYQVEVTSGAEKQIKNLEVAESVEREISVK